MPTDTKAPFTEQSSSALELFHPAVRDWFEAVFAAPTRPQVAGWPAIARDECTLILAPAGSGKTLAAFLWCINRIMAMYLGQVESAHYPRNPLDVLAQQIVAIVSIEDWTVEKLFELMRSAAPYAALTRSIFESVLDMLSGRYPSDEFAGLRPRITWDRVANKLTGQQGSQRVAIMDCGTIPDRGLYGVFLAGASKGARVGELDEEMVFEGRQGDTIILGA